MSQTVTKPLIVQSDHTLLLDVHEEGFEAARADISAFAELEKSPEHMHTYRITPLSLWNAAAAGLAAGEITARLEGWSRFPVPENVKFSILETVCRFGKLRLVETDEPQVYFLEVNDPAVYAELGAQKKLNAYLTPAEGGFLVDLYNRGTVKQELIKIGYPVKDEAPLKEGDTLELELRSIAGTGYSFYIRDYQEEAAETFIGENKPGNGFGVIVLPCGAGKTIVGLNVIAKLRTNTLILSTNVAAVHQWIDELTDKTTLTRDEIGEYSGDIKEIKPVTVVTYQILTWRKNKEEDFPHFGIFRAKNW
ncbi:MAG: helicase-associated domain-containing protein, partial [bacterium]